jgi:hypothetical protein
MAGDRQMKRSAKKLSSGKSGPQTLLILWNPEGGDASQLKAVGPTQVRCQDYENLAVIPPEIRCKANFALVEKFKNKSPRRQKQVDKELEDKEETDQGDDQEEEDEEENVEHLTQPDERASVVEGANAGRTEKTTTEETITQTQQNVEVLGEAEQRHSKNNSKDNSKDNDSPRTTPKRQHEERQERTDRKDDENDESDEDDGEFDFEKEEARCKKLMDGWPRALAHTERMQKLAKARLDKEREANGALEAIERDKKDKKRLLSIFAEEVDFRTKMAKIWNEVETMNREAQSLQDLRRNRFLDTVKNDELENVQFENLLATRNALVRECGDKIPDDDLVGNSDEHVQILRAFVRRSRMYAQKVVDAAVCGRTVE